MERLHDPVLENDWHAVYLTSELKEKPVAVTLLGERVVLYRNSRGVQALRDLCIHRGAMLSKGWVKDDAIVCPYHGWHYNGEGQCVCIPAQPAGERIPLRAKTAAYACEEKYGFVWICLGEPTGPVPHFEEFANPAFRPLPCGPYKVKAAGTRVIENFTDFAHLMFVHQDLLGHPDYAELPDIQVIKEKNRIYIENIPIFQPVAHSGSDKSEGTTYVYRKEVYRPLSGRLSKTDPGNGQTLWILLTVAPVAADECLVFMMVARNYGFDVDDENFIRFQDIVFDQDAQVIESQKPELLPLDLQAELNHRVDVFSVAYRRWLNELGVKVGTI
ncbi:aromatic ring-hydroxylating dioxygenase subunit alpha [Paenibacillus rhizovicinus]|uniref:Aromatic ring-hydroxylating dioxygenase subunit alpha n=1 Tax=Paenibacillus rhizovicinus TaxID=2704463 RepID=A0A6C0P8Y1_9BACL|nr:aromatic ring-hydroxylating dioxygenase subunit alpha [Paenibacillus rhizovicinus]QHW34851.1 aromatic ring-hydroxylating dioxygenase subunit alpha [Paenibacillus rhizovicinus]